MKHLLACAIFSLVATSGCVQLSTFQTAKTVPKGDGEILVALGGGGISGAFDGGSVGFGTYELAGRLGVGDKTDVGFKISHFVSYLADVKFQFVGDQESKFAMATGPGLGLYAFGFGAAIFQGTVPLHMSIHPSDRFAVYLTPRYSTQFSIANGFNALHYLGGSVGMETGRKVRFGADVSYMGLLNHQYNNDVFDGFGLGLFQVGIGVKFRLQNIF